MRELNDRGFQPCLLEDATASYFPEFKEVSIEMIIAQGGLIGWKATVAMASEALRSMIEEEFNERPAWVPSVAPLLLPPDEPLADSGSTTISSSTTACVRTAHPSPFYFPVESTACIVIDMQRDFVLEGGFGSTLGNNVSLLQSIVPTVKELLDACRKYGVRLIHTLEAHKEDLSDCPVAKLTRGQLPEGLRIGDKGSMGRILVQHEWGNEIVDENAPAVGEKVIHKPGKGAFCGTDLHKYLLDNSITHLLFAGVTTEVCVQTSMREANDRGYECLLVSDCTESYFPHFKYYTLKMISAQGAIVGWTATKDEVEKALSREFPSKAQG
eukprot:TRINITY_DN3231_c0_g1_i1.p1 TRINITY_DN3231_c0_g1~~TRINITY_DN3231_c0_g1_i1.p1  ORF type:complete len:327 (+),score=64.84 TRINITY_DN3231_c0_g1_i1:311-1291(+)